MPESVFAALVAEHVASADVKAANSAIFQPEFVDTGDEVVAVRRLELPLSKRLEKGTTAQVIDSREHGGGGRHNTTVTIMLQNGDVHDVPLSALRHDREAVTT